MADSTTQNRSIYRLRWIGYGLLVFSFIDIVQVLIPPNFTNPGWEFQTIGAVVERVAVPLLGFALIFFGEYYDRVRFEKIPLKILSWLCLVLTIIFLLMIPLGVINTFRLRANINQQVDVVTQQGQQRLQQAETQLNQAPEPALQQLREQLQRANPDVDVSTPEKVRDALRTRLEEIQAQGTTQLQQQAEQQRINLYKNSVKWNLGALIAAALFFLLWRSTDWARR